MYKWDNNNVQITNVQMCVSKNLQNVNQTKLTNIIKIFIIISKQNFVVKKNNKLFITLIY